MVKKVCFFNGPNPMQKSIQNGFAHDLDSHISHLWIYQAWDSDDPYKSMLHNATCVASGLTLRPCQVRY